MTYMYEIKIYPEVGRDEINVNMEKTNPLEIFKILTHYNNYYRMVIINFCHNDVIIGTITTDNVVGLCYRDIANIFRKRNEQFHFQHTA